MIKTSQNDTVPKKTLNLPNSDRLFIVCQLFFCSQPTNKFLLDFFHVISSLKFIFKSWVVSLFYVLTQAFLPVWFLFPRHTPSLCVMHLPCILIFVPKKSFLLLLFLPQMAFIYSSSLPLLSLSSCFLSFGISFIPIDTKKHSVLLKCK